jgi:hypothetical protein
MVQPRIQPGTVGLPQPPQPSQPKQPTNGGINARDYVNQKLAELWQQTGDRTIIDYINSGWTTPVSPAVQQRVQAIVLRYGGGQQPVAVTPQGRQSPVPGNVDAPQPVPDAPLPASSIWPDQPPQATGTGYQNSAPPPGAQAVPDPNVLPVGDKGGGFFSGPPPNQQGPGGYTNETTPGAIGLGGPAAPGVVAGQRAGAAATQAGGARPTGGSTVSAGGPGFSPAGGNPLTNPAGGGGATGAFGAIDPTSAIGQQGYTQAQAGDPTALSAVLASVLGKFGIDVNRGGIFTPGLVSSLAPYLKTVMEYGGLANGGKPVIPSQLADQFGGMVGGANTFGQIQDFARNLLPTAQGLLGAPAGALADSGNQVGMVNDLLGMLTAGANPLYQQYQQGINKKTLSDYVQSQLGGPTQNYIDWMRNNAARTPGSDLLAQIIGASR